MNQFIIASVLVGISLAPFMAVAADEVSKTDLLNTKNKVVGMVTLTQLAQAVKIEIDAKQLPPGKHAIHIHETGLCQGPSFKTAGEHYNPNGAQHGFDQAGGPHNGDLPNVIVDAQGNLKVEMLAPNVRLGVGSNSLLKSKGTALVIHAKADDDHTQPSGDAGDRIACAAIKEAKSSTK